jgi:hypothetical protein
LTMTPHSAQVSPSGSALPHRPPIFSFLFHIVVDYSFSVFIGFILGF